MTVRVGPVIEMAKLERYQPRSLGRGLHLTFTARVAVSTADSRYVVELRAADAGSVREPQSRHPPLADRT